MSESEAAAAAAATAATASVPEVHSPPVQDLLRENSNVAIDDAPLEGTNSSILYCVKFKYNTLY